MKYDRELLLFGAKRNEVLELWEVQRYGVDSFGDPDHVSIFGMRPSEWYARAIRLLGRTAVECTRDALADSIAKDIASLCAYGSREVRIRVIDPFAGSANTLYWIVRHLPTSVGLGVELDSGVCSLTKQNLARLALPIKIRNGDYRSTLGALELPADVQVIAFVAPPWGQALSRATGLNLMGTTPPILEVVEFLIERLQRNSLLCAIQLLETTTAGSLEQVRKVFDWSEVRLYELNASYGLRPGILLGTKGWIPAGSGPASTIEGKLTERKENGSSPKHVERLVGPSE